ncbi:chemotaxis protein CheW [Simiduia sp. 21SJ11W-1]|uniref:chemotaxis protein CheW n=1 Tax=Simiduia sp. 21SJ11W-1 TaxID=2909669 RepID=UPI00209C92FE|nr:chemotaxis protein CheW [Simiduia sp. 21SJ11W-1]UTA47693.1 chemotaxis protein CheW [Simiduia sp. 21SJ11W-1]
MNSQTTPELIAVPEVHTAAQDAYTGIDFISTGDQYLTFYLGRELYGVDILNVTEIRGWDAPTRIPNAAGYMKGVVNIRGLVIPIIDLRILFGVGEPTYNATTVVVVLAIHTAQIDRTMGFVVDAVSDVLDVDAAKIKPGIHLTGTVSKSYIRGCVNSENETITLLELSQIIQLDRSG